MARSAIYKTRQREAILDYIVSLKGVPVTAAQIEEHFEKAAVPIGRATIYRHLDKLTESGKLRRYTTDGISGSCYQLMDNDENCRIHSHLKCEDCGELQHLECEKLNEIQEHVLDMHDFEVNALKTVFYGKCGKCLRLHRQVASENFRQPPKKLQKLTERGIKMKRFTLVIALLLAVATTLSGCKQADSDGKISVVCTIFPQYDWVRQIIGDNADNINLTLLLDKKIDLHSYQPSVGDIAKISTSDLFIYVGGESDEWVHDALREAVNKKMIVVNLVDALGDAAKAEEIVEGMESDEDDEDEAVYDEHVWLSLKNARIFSTNIANALASLDPNNAVTYTNNLAAYIDKLTALDGEYRSAVSAAPVKTLLFGDRFPFRYLVDDYGLNYYATFAGCSAETEASFNTIIFLAKKVDELKLNAIMVTESANQSIARTIIGNASAKNQKIFELDSMQSVTSSDVQSGKTYLSLMENNLNVLKEALR